jgi:hypothetical protein
MGRILGIFGLIFLLGLSDRAAACAQKPPEFGFADHLRELTPAQIPSSCRKSWSKA